MTHPNARHVVTTPISLEVNEALDRAEEELLHDGGDPVSVLNEVQTELAPRLNEALAYHKRP